MPIAPSNKSTTHAPGPSGDGADPAPEPREGGRHGGHDERPPPARDGERGADGDGVDDGRDEARQAVEGFGDGEDHEGVDGVDDACIDWSIGLGGG